MSTLRTLYRACSAGELTEELFGQVALEKLSSGLATCKNFVSLPHGPAQNRAGFQYINEVKDSNAKTQLIPFSYNNIQTYAVEAGDGYFRFHTQSATLSYTDGAAYSGATAYTIGNIAKSGGINYYCKAPTTGNIPPNATYWYPMPTAPNIYEIPSPYATTDVMDLHFVQSADVLTITHTSYPVGELRRYGAQDWRYVTPSFDAPANVLTGVGAVATGAGAILYSYKVTTVSTDGLEESVGSSTVTATGDITIAGQYVTVNWTDTSGLNVRYHVYRLTQGVFGFIGMAGASGFVDKNITPDTSRTPPINDSPFTGAGNYPAAVSYAEQRRLFGGTINKPQNLWMTRSGTESNMSYNVPLRDDNRIAVRVAAREASAIRHIVPIGQILLMTASCEWRVTSVNSDALTPSSINIKPQSYQGSNNVPPVVVGNVVLFAAAHGGHIREMAYRFQSQGYETQDVSLFATHLFDGNSVIAMAYSKGPVPVIWVVSSDGRLLGMTYIPEQEVAAWHQHTTGVDDKFEAACVLSEAEDDKLYVVVKRNINGVTKRFVEVLHSRTVENIEDSFFVDCGQTYDGAPTTSLTGLTWLEGMTVSILADGCVVPNQVVTGGAIMLPVAASKVHVGLPIKALLRTTPIYAQTDQGFSVGRVRNVNQIWLRVVRSSEVKAGPDEAHLVEYAQRTNEVYGSPPRLLSDVIGPIVVTGAWTASGQITIAHEKPLPLSITSIAEEYALGGG